MEIFFVYSLVFLFLLGFALFSMLILATHSNREETTSALARPSPPASAQENLIAYGVLAALFLFFTFITLLSRQQRIHFQLDMRK
ncbi:MAG TPA: hypothetical protein VGL94_05025 [Ktedonobacteraceae bacterium]|jgi:hypothetical protein